LGPEPATMRPGDDQLRGDDRADAWLVQQRGRECAYMGEDFTFQLGRFAACCSDSASEASQDEPCRELVGSRRARAAKAATALEPRGTAGLEHVLATLGEVTRKPGAVAASALDRQGASAAGCLLGEPQRRRAAACVRPQRPPRQHSSCCCGDDRQDMLVPVRVDADDVVQLICKHPTDPPTSLVGSGGAGLSTGTRGGRTVMSQAEKADKLLIKPAAGAGPPPPRTRRQFIPKARTRQPLTR